MGIPRSKLEVYLSPLIQEGEIQARIFGDSIYYEIGKIQKK
jgi:hypothetical protein